ncbi:MAG: molybdate ABC transporter substrate-binding protein [Pseudomonadota bacterium]
MRPRRNAISTDTGRWLTRRGVLGLGAGAAAASAFGGRQALASTHLTIAAAANLRMIMPELLASFADTNAGMAPRVSFGASGNLARQIVQGAPFDVFLSADRARVDIVAKQQPGLKRATFAEGRLALLVRQGLRITASDDLSGLSRAIADGRIKRFAIANPQHAPFGMAAQAALETSGVWDGLKGRLAFGENVAQAAQFVVSGNADAALVALSLAMSPDVASRTTYAAVSPKLHAPLKQEMALIRPDKPAADAFFAFMLSAPAQAILAKSGYAGANEG